MTLTESLLGPRIRTIEVSWMMAAPPVMAHGLEHGIVKLDGPRDEQGRMRRLTRHLGLCLQRSCRVLRLSVCDSFLRLDG